MVFELIPEETFGRVVLSGPYRFEVWISDRRIREAADRHDVTLPTGEATLRILNPGYSLDRRLTVDGVDGELGQVFAPILGSLTVFSNPGNCESSSMRRASTISRSCDVRSSLVSTRCRDVARTGEAPGRWARRADRRRG